MELLESFNLVQHIDKPTHIRGHTLDLMITRPSVFVQNAIVDYLLSDHISVLCDLSLEKPSSLKKHITYRKYRDIDITVFREDLQEKLISVDLNDDFLTLVTTYRNVVSGLIEKHSPLQAKSVMVRPQRKYISQEVRIAKRTRRRYEQKWRSTKSPVDCERFTEQRDLVTRLMHDVGRDFISNCIMDNAGNPKSLFNVLNSLLCRKQPSPLPTHTSPEDLANKFGNYFTTKIEKILEFLQQKKYNSGINFPEASFHGIPLDEFHALSQDEVKKLIMKALAKSWIHCLLGFLNFVYMS